MAHGNITIPVPGELRAVDVNGRVVSADGVYDYNESKSQETINAEVKETIGTGGSVDSRIVAAVNALDSTKSQAAGADGLALNIVEENGKITSISGSIASGTYDAAGSASAAQTAAISAAATDATNKVSAAKTELLGDAASDYNTLGKLEDKIQAEASARQSADTAINGRVNNLETAVGSGGSVDTRIAAAKAEIKGNATSACDTLGEAEAKINANTTAISNEATARANAISTEATRAQTAEEQLRTLYNNLQQSQPIPVTSLPATGEVGKIYRLAGTNSYADYMYAEGALTTPIKMAEYDNAIDDEPTAGSDNLVKSKGVDKRFLDSDFYLKALTYCKRIGFINSSNQWRPLEGSGICIPTEGVTSLSIIRKTNAGPSQYAYLTENVYETGNLSFVDGYSSRISLSINRPITSFPEGCKYIWIIGASGSGDLSYAPEDFGVTINNADFLGNFFNLLNSLDNDSFAIGFAFPINGIFSYDPIGKVLTPPEYFDIVNTNSHAQYKSTRAHYTNGPITFVNQGTREQLLLYNYVEGANVLTTVNGDRSTVPSGSVVLGIVDVTTGKEYFNFPYKIDGSDSTAIIEQMGHESHGNLLSLSPFVLDYIETKYWASEQDDFNAFVQKVDGRKGSGIYQIALVTDTHEGGLYAKDDIFALRSISLFNRLADHVDICMHGGDVSCDYGTSVSRNFAYMQEVIKLFNIPNGKSLLITKGNHDTNDSGFREVNPIDVDWNSVTYYVNSGNSGTFTQVTKDTYRGGDLYVVNAERTTDTLFRFIQSTNAPDNIVWGNGAYYYYDDTVSKIRFVVANSYPINDLGISGASDEWKWFVQTALDLSEKSTPTDWMVVVLRHTESSSNTTFNSIANAFMTGNSVTVEDVTVNYGTLNGGGIRMIHLHGHEHGSAGYSNMGGYLDIGFRNASVEKRHLGNTNKYPVYVISINRNTGKMIIDGLFNNSTYTYDYINGIVELPVGGTILMARSGLSSQAQAVWSTSNSGVATVDAGNVTGVATGLATITGTLDEITVTYTVKVVN